MPDFKQLNKELVRGLKASIPYTDIRLGYIGKISAVDTINPDPTEGLSVGYVWVRFDNNGEAIRARCHKISARMPDMPVRVGRDVVTKEWTVIEIVPMSVGEINNLASTFSVPDRNPNLIYETFDANRYLNLHVIAGENAFDVEVEAGLYWYHGELKAWTGGSINIISSLPSGGFGGSKRGVLIGIDPSTNTLTTYDGERIGLFETPGDEGKYFTESYIAETINDADSDVYWLVLIPLRSNDSNWNDLYRVTALTLLGGNGASLSSGTVRVSSDDTTADYLSGKITGGLGVDLTILNPGVDEDLEIAVDESALSLANLGTRLLGNLSNVILTAPNDLDALHYDGGSGNWINGDVYVRNTGDTVTGMLLVSATNSFWGLVAGTTYTASGSDALARTGLTGTVTLNQNGANLTHATAALGLDARVSITGASGTVTGAAGVYAVVQKSDAGHLSNGYGVLVGSHTKSGAGNFTNAYGVYVEPITVGSNNYAIYTNAGQVRLGDSTNLTQSVASGAPSALFTLTSAAHTALTASTERTEVLLNLGATQQWDTGALTLQRFMRIIPPTMSFVGASTVTNAITLDINAPLAGSNATLTNRIAIRANYRMQVAGTLDIVPTAETGSPRNSILLTAPAHTALATVEYVDVDLALNRNVQFTTGGTIGTQRAIVIRPPVYTATSATQTITDAYTLELTGPPVAGTNVSITNSRTFRVASGVTRLDGQVQINNLVVMGEANNFQFGTSTGTKLGTGTSQKIALWNKTPIVQPTALTTALTTVTFTAPGATDYSMTDPAVGGLGFANLNEARTLFSVIANLQTRTNELETRLTNFGFLP